MSSSLLHKHPIGLLGGTFDPVHCGHLKMADQLLTELQLKIIQFIPNREPPHREKPVASAEHRLAMLRIALCHRHDFVVNDMEMARPTPSYTIDTLKTLRTLIPDHPFCLILGTDAFSSFNQWYRWEQILDLCHIVIVNRPSIPLIHQPWMHELFAHRQTHNFNDLATHATGKILIKEIKPIAISASEIRRKIVAGEDVSNDLPSKVLHYIEQHHLYR